MNNTEDASDQCGLPEALTPAARRARERFIKTYKANLRKVQNIALNILVWGPSLHTQSGVAKKRDEIRRMLCAQGHNAMFSEDLEEISPSISLKMQEFAQARSADLIIVLVEDSPGALAEAHDFCNDPELAPHMLIMFPRRNAGGFSGRGAISIVDEGYGTVFWYDDDDIPACNVLKRALKCAEARRLVQAFHSRGGRR